jgi:hypothetical protein
MSESTRGDQSRWVVADLSPEERKFEVPELTDKTPIILYVRLSTLFLYLSNRAFIPSLSCLRSIDDFEGMLGVHTPPRIQGFLTSLFGQFSDFFNRYQWRKERILVNKVAAQENDNRMWESAAQAVENSPLQKQWDGFAKTVDQLQKEKDSDEQDGRPDMWGCSRELLTQLASAIRKHDFNAFNELMKQVRPETVQICFHYPDLTEPGITDADVEALSRFIKPPPPDYAAKFRTYIAEDLKSVTETLSGITDAASAKAAQLKLLDVDSALYYSHDLWNQVPDAAKPSIRTELGVGISNVEQLVGKVTAIPGAGDIIGPEAKSVLEKLKSF